MTVLAEAKNNVEMRPAIAVERKIGRHHIAFFRAILLGMDMGEMSDQYLETGMRSLRRRFPLVSGVILRSNHLALSGVPVNVIQRLLGHASLQITNIYTDKSDENLWRQVEGVRPSTGNAHRL